MQMECFTHQQWHTFLISMWGKKPSESVMKSEAPSEKKKKVEGDWVNIMSVMLMDSQISSLRVEEPPDASCPSWCHLAAVTTELCPQLTAFFSS